MERQLISRDEALRLRLPGAQFIRDIQRVYLSEQSPFYGAMELLRQARLSVFDAYRIKNAKELQAIMTGDESRRARHLCYNRTRHEALDDFKIGAGIELCLKARLLGNGYVVHRLDLQVPATAALAKTQKSRPIKISEMLQCVGFMFDTTKTEPCFIPGLTPRSLPFDWLIEKHDYFTACDLSGRHLETARIFRDLRNMIHLPIGQHDRAELHFSAALGYDDILEFIERYIDKYSVSLAPSIEEDNMRRHLSYCVTEKLVEPD